MTRINAVPVEELSDQHLIREYNELPRCIKQPLNIKDAPDTYTLGTGHMKWGRKHWHLLLKRYGQLCKELKYRGFNTNYTAKSLKNFWYATYPDIPLVRYCFTEQDIKVSRQRLKEKIALKPNWYRWTLRPVPKYVQRLKKCA